METGERAQGHNSVLTTEDGQVLLIYHTRFNDGTEGHQVRAHQLFLNSDGWPVAAPFEYNGETITDNDVATTQMFSEDEIPGVYQVIIHKYKQDQVNLEEETPVKITLEEDGTISGAYTGSWEIYQGSSYVTITVGGTEYKGVIVEQQMEPTTIKAIALTACSGSGVNLWAYRMEDQYALAYTINSNEMPVKDGKTVSSNVDLYGLDLQDGVTLQWTSDNPDIISSTGRYNPTGLTENVTVALTAEMTCGNYYWTETYNVTAYKETTPTGDYLSSLMAYYDFDEEPLVNAYNTSEVAQLLSEGTTSAPTFEKDSLRNGSILHQYFGASGACSYTLITNPLNGQELDGFTVSLWVKRTDDVTWDAIWSFYDSSANARLYLTGNSYIGYNDGTNWFDINHPNTVVSDNIPVGEWTLVTITVSRDDGCTIYIGSTKIRSVEYEGSYNGTDITSASAFDNNLIVDFVQECPNFYLGYGSFWGSVDVRVDDLLIYGRALSASDVRALNTMSNRVTDFTVGEGGTSIAPVVSDTVQAPEGIYDLSGRKVQDMRKGIYIVDGKKVLNK